MYNQLLPFSLYFFALHRRSYLRLSQVSFDKQRSRLFGFYLSSPANPQWITLSLIVQYRMVCHTSRVAGARVLSAFNPASFSTPGICKKKKKKIRKQILKFGSHDNIFVSRSTINLYSRARNETEKNLTAITLKV